MFASQKIATIADRQVFMLARSRLVGWWSEKMASLSGAKFKVHFPEPTREG